MRLYNAVNHCYVIAETLYGVSCVDTLTDENDYDIRFDGKLEVNNLPEYIREIIENESTDLNDETVDVYKGTVTTVAGTESITVYVPETWD